jgi:hypothetical protein
MHFLPCIYSQNVSTIYAIIPVINWTTLVASLVVLAIVKVASFYFIITIILVEVVVNGSRPK